VFLGRARRSRTRLRVPSRSPALATGVVVAILAGVAGAVLLTAGGNGPRGGTLGPSSALAPHGQGSQPVSSHTASGADGRHHASTALSDHTGQTGGSARRRAGDPSGIPAWLTGGAQLTTSCQAVVHIGDSTSDGLVLPAYQPVASLRAPAQYRQVGVTRFIPEVSGARSIVETWHGFPNAYTVAQRLIRRGYRGCWVLAVGTNDAADVAVGSNVGMAQRISRMMSLTGGQPVMWVNVKTLLSSGPYAERYMRAWNTDLLRACRRYPNMRVFNWAAAARRSWFIGDGIHYTPLGYAARARDIARALALAFPADMALLEHRIPDPGRTGAAVSASGCLVS
jgi:lysophospholipase L1-like esterase